ncbi:MAG: TldD/PmbA family protein [Bdellovibrionota bacterium]
MKDKLENESISTMATKLTDLAQDALGMAKEIGVDEAKVATTLSLQKKLVVENKKLSSANSVESQNIKITVHKDQKKGSSSLNSLNHKALNSTVKAANDLASFSVADEFLCMAGEDIAPKAKTLDFIYDQEAADIDLDELSENINDALAVLTKNPKVAIDYFELSQEISYHGIANSHDIQQSEIQTMISWNFMGMAVDGSDVSSLDYDYNFAFEKYGYLNKLKEQANAFSDKLAGLLNPIKCPSYNGPILLTPRAVYSILIETILYHASGRSVMDGKSKWQNEIDNEVVSKKLNLTDNPHNIDLSGATSFDADGIPTYQQTILKNGILKTHLHSCYSAKKTGKKSTAQAGGPFGLVLDPGLDSLKSMIDTGSNLLVVDRFSGNNDPVSGDFSGVAKSSRLFKNGDDCGAVSETMIAGNFFEITKHVLAVSQEAELVHGNFASPWVLIDGVSVTGA